MMGSMPPGDSTHATTHSLRLEVAVAGHACHGQPHAENAWRVRHTCGTLDMTSTTWIGNLTKNQARPPTH
ncbi:hypothetical protein NL676_005300 [Syzygium grande]|nr:hypothetical protein NL676_005300 [Syzygium grande]